MLGINSYHSSPGTLLRNTVFHKITQGYRTLNSNGKMILLLSLENQRLRQQWSFTRVEWAKRRKQTQIWLSSHLWVGDKFTPQCVLPSCISPNLRHICDKVSACSLGYFTSKGRIIIIALKIIYHYLLKVSGVLGILLNPFETQSMYSSHKPWEAVINRAVL